MKLLCLQVLLWVSFTVQAATTLPIEVLGEPGHLESVTLNLRAGASTVTGLMLKIHGLTFENKASIKINDSDWLDLNDDSVTFPRVERAFFGMGGPLSTLRMVLPLPAQSVQNGANTLQFRFNDLDGKTIGYRVLALNFVAGTTELIPASEFVAEDPRAWKPPLTTPEAIAEGKALWYTASLMEGAVAMRVSCTDCHAHDGRDLKYFNYSNKSIIERSLFHQLSRPEAEKVASYIRSLNVPYEEKGRPWNPPYQPGPGLDAQPVRSWAAGAGLEWVLDNDLETLRYIFPDGPRVGSIEFTNTLNAREIPLAVQMPDWNHWLPAIHPNDAYPNIFPDHEFVQIYPKIRSLLSGKARVAAANVLLAQRSYWDRAGSSTGIAKPDRKSPAAVDYGYRQKGLAHWRITKTWEMMTEFKAEDVGQELEGPMVNDRRWFHGEIFRLAPHMMSLPPFDSWYAESMHWYQLQVILNDGNRRNGGAVPIDWGYLHALNFSAWNNPVKMPTYGIAVLNMIKGGEVGENGIPLGQAHAWSPFKQHIYGLAPGDHWGGQFASIDLPLRRRVAESLIAPWLKKAESYSRREYLAAGMLDTNFRNLIRETTKSYAELGVDPVFVNRLRALGKKLWPVGKVPAAPGNVTSTSLEVGDRFNQSQFSRMLQK